MKASFFLSLFCYSQYIIFYVHIESNSVGDIFQWCKCDIWSNGRDVLVSWICVCVMSDQPALLLTRWARHIDAHTTHAHITQHEIEFLFQNYWNMQWPFSATSKQLGSWFNLRITLFASEWKQKQEYWNFSINFCHSRHWKVFAQRMKGFSVGDFQFSAVFGIILIVFHSTDSLPHLSPNIISINRMNIKTIERKFRHSNVKMLKQIQ